MTLSTVLLGFLQAESSRERWAAAWERHEAQLRTVELEWEITRSSADASFGFREQPNRLRPMRLQITGNQVCEQGDRLTVVMPDGRTRPAEIDPESARRQFRHMLLEERLAGVQTTPFLEPVTSVWTIGESGPSRRFGELEQLLFDVPIWCARPSMLLAGSRDDHATTATVFGGIPALRFVVNAVPGVRRTVWVEAAGGFRVLRVIETRLDGATYQADLSYRADEDLFPTSWTVQRLNSVGQPLEFVTVSRTSARINPQIDESVFQTPLSGSRDDAPRFSASQLAMRRGIRSTLDAAVSWPALAVVVLLTLAVFRRHQPGKQAPTAGDAAARKRLRRQLAALALIAIGLFVLSRLPIGELSLREVHQRLDAVHAQIGPAKGHRNAQAPDPAGRGALLEQLQVLADEIRQRENRRQGLWNLFRSPDPEADAAWRDLRRLTEGELPALVKAGGSGSELRERSVQATLARVDDHLAGAHPYLPPPVPVVNQAGLEDSGRQQGSTLLRSLLIVAAEIVGLGVAWSLWSISRRRSSRAAGPTETNSGTEA